MYLEATEFIHSLGDDSKTSKFLDKISATEGLCSMSDDEMLSTIKKNAFEARVLAEIYRMFEREVKIKGFKPCYKLAYPRQKSR